jgi:hypothetical protein
MGPCSLEGIYCLPQEIVCVLVVYLKMEIWVATGLPNFASFLNVTIDSREGFIWKIKMLG